MRVAIDATPLTLSSGGLRRYTLELSVALAENFPEDQFVLMSDQPFAMPEPAHVNLIRGGGPRNVVERKWWLWGVEREMRRLRAELFHGTDFAVPYLARRPSVMTVHDLSPWMNPEWHHDADRVRTRTPLLIELGVATMIVTDSESVRKEAIDRFRLQPARVVTVPLAASVSFRPVERSPLVPEPAPYFLHVGTLEPRKNVLGLIDAWREVRKQHAVEMVLAGRRRADFPELAPEVGLRVLDEVLEAELPALYSGSVAVVYPSWYEGFGLPVLEAMQCGACVISSRDAAISEVAAGAAVQVDAGDTRALAAAMTAVLQQPRLREEMRQKALRRSSEFSWSTTAQMTRQVYEEARKRFA